MILLIVALGRPARHVANYRFRHDGCQVRYTSVLAQLAAAPPGAPIATLSELPADRRRGGDRAPGGLASNCRTAGAVFPAWRRSTACVLSR